jgi:hypothetical protein
LIEEILLVIFTEREREPEHEPEPDGKGVGVLTAVASMPTTLLCTR